jgi:thioredoxin 2
MGGFAKPGTTMSNIVCTHCSAINRITAGRNALDAKCGKCGHELFSGEPADLESLSLERQIARSDVPVLVDVWAPWCGPCRMMAPEFEKAAQALEPQVRFTKLNSDDNQDLAGRLGIRGIPTMILFASGKEVARTSGAMPAGQIVQWVSANLPGRRS